MVIYFDSGKRCEKALNLRHFRRELAYTHLPERPKPKTVNKKKNENRSRGATIMEQYVPPTNHVWRSFSFGQVPPWAR